MASRTDPIRMTSNAIDRAIGFPPWIKRMSMNERLNYIVRMYSETCGDNWYLWIETAVETLPMLIYALKAISKVDVIKEVLEHKYSCGLRQVIGDAKKAPRTRWQKAKVLFWKVEGVRARLFWYWLIAEAFTDYVVNWQSIVVKEQRCNDPPHAGPCILDSPGSTLGSIIGTTQLFWDVREFDPSNWSGTGGDPANITPAAIGTYNVGASVVCHWGLPGNITWNLEIFDGLGHIVASSASVTHPSNIPSSASCFARATALSPGQAKYAVNVRVTQSPGGTFGSCPSGTFSVGIAK